jgi:hypothetical protein
MKFDKIVPYDFSINTGKAYIIFINIENAYDEYHLSIIRPGHNDPNLGVHGWQISENLFSVKSVKENNMLKILLGPDIVCHMSSGSNYEILIGNDKQYMTRHHISWKGVPSIRKPSIPSTNGIELQLINDEISITEDYTEKKITKTETIKIKEDIISNISHSIENKTDIPLNSIDKLKLEVSMKVFDNYCNINTFDNLVKFGIQNCGLDQTETQIILKMEFENRKITNEKKLVTEMESLLHQFTDKDKKLDDKERDDTIQLFCKARPGYQQGLNFEFANNYITTFCRKNSVKIKVRFLKWEIP